EVSSWIGAAATLTRRPAQLTGALHLGGTAAVGVGPFGVGVGIRARLSGRSPTPFEVSGRVSVTVDLPPPLKDLDVDLELTWRQPAVPQVEDPWMSALAQHPLCTESWPLTDSVSAGDMDDAGDVVDAPDLAAPVVPLDAGVLLTFAQPMGDLVPAADNPPGTAPATVLGDDVADYALTGLRLSRRRRAPPGGAGHGRAGRPRPGVGTRDPGRGRRGSPAAADVPQPVRLPRVQPPPLDRRLPGHRPGLAVRIGSRARAGLPHLGRPA